MGLARHERLGLVLDDVQHGCHTFEAAGSTGAVGPSLDESTLPRARIVEIVTNGRGGMPSFAGRLSGEEIERIAAFVAEQRRGG